MRDDALKMNSADAPPGSQMGDDVDPIARGPGKPPATDEFRPNPSALDDALERFTRSGSGEGQPLPRRVIRFRVDHLACEPGVFAEDFWLTLRGISSHDELAAADEAGQSVTKMVYAMAKRAIFGFNDQPIDRIRREFLWEALGLAGRALVTSMFDELGQLPPDAAKKAHDSMQVGG